MTDRAQSILYLFLFSYFLWGGFSLILYQMAMDDYYLAIVAKKNCTVKDQYGVCYTATEYQNYLKYRECREKIIFGLIKKCL